MKEFFYKEHSIRSICREAKSWFVVKDICVIFNFPHFRDWVSRQDVHHFKLLAAPVRKTWMVDRQGLFLLMKKIAPVDGKVFARWLINESRAEFIDQKSSEPEVKLTHGAALQVIEERELLGKDFRMYGTADEPLFLAKDVAAWIEHTNPTEMIRMVDDDEKLNSTILSSGQKREFLFLTEDGLYEVLMQSRKPIAKEFKKRVKEVLRSIRRTGSYHAPRMIAGYPVPEDLESMLRVMTNLAAELRKQEDVILRLSEALEDQATIMDMAARSCRGYTRILLEKRGVCLGGGVGDGLVGENA